MTDLPSTIYLNPASPRWYSDDGTGRVPYVALDAEPDPGVAQILYWRARAEAAEARCETMRAEIEKLKASEHAKTERLRELIASEPRAKGDPHA